MSDALTVITMPQPTANGPLHLGHLSGPYLAADMAARAARLRGERVILTTGLDIHQNYVLTRAENEGLAVDRMLADFRAEITGTYARAGIGYDNFTDPDDPAHERIINAILNDMVDAGAVRMQPVPLLFCDGCGRTLHHSYVAGRCAGCGAGAAGGTCEECGAFTSADTLVAAACGRCGGPPRQRPTEVPVLRLEDVRDRLTTVWLTAQLPARFRAMLGRLLADRLPDIPVAYPTNWGIEGTGALAGLRVDSYTEIALTDLYGNARAVAPDATDLAGFRAAWRRVDALWHFHGIDNAFWYGVYWPAVWAAAGIDPLPLSGLVVNEFYTLTGSKFSTSRNHAVWANELLDAEDRAVVRLYLAWDRPDRYSSDFTPARFAAFRDRVLPLLKGAPGDDLPEVLRAADRDRADDALRLAGFDAALAVRSLLSLLAGGDADHPRTVALTRALTGVD